MKSAHRSAVKAPGSVRTEREFIEVPRDRIASLERALRREIEGEVRFSPGDRALYATDASNYRQVPYGVVIPRSAEDVVAAVRLCAAHDVPITPRGGGTSLAGQTCNSAVIIDFSKYMHKIIALDPKKRLAVVEPGCVLDHLRSAAEAHGLTFGPDPATHDHNTLGGMIGNDSCGVHSIMAGRTADNVAALDVVTYDGERMNIGPTPEPEFQAILAAGGRSAEIYRAMATFWRRWGDKFLQVYPNIPRRISGFENLDQLAPEKGFNVARALVGTEARCAIILRATLNLVKSPRCRVLALLGFDDVFAAADAVPKVLRFHPMAIEGIDGLLVSFMKRKHFKISDLAVLPNGNAWLVVEFGGDNELEATGKANALIDNFRPHCVGTKLVSDRAQQKEVWDVREAGLAVTAHVPGADETWPGWEDSAVAPELFGKYLREFKSLLHKHGYEASCYGHFGDGLVHCRINFELGTEQGLANWRTFLEEAADLVVRYGGSISGEHGDGQARGALIERMYGRELVAAQEEFRAIWDPRAGLNPGKILAPYPPDSNLRVGPDYAPRPVKGVFDYPLDEHSYTKAMLRCVGVGKCRRRDTQGEVMCPSYLATNEERHSTRGRARLLFEMMRGDFLDGGFDNAEVEEALDLCLACKGCKHDCPVEVDMAAYKAEFRAMHYRSKLRPRSAYSMGRIADFAALSACAPEVANFFLQTPIVSNAAKWLGGIAQQRSVPRFSSPTFRHWHRRTPRRSDGERVILWPDTFNNYFRSETAIAATQLLENLGFEVAIPAARLCCGRPLYDWGWLERAKKLWRRTFEILAEDIATGTPIIGLEPACVSAFRDELPALFPEDAKARALSKQTLFITEFFEQRGLTPNLTSNGASKILVQVHCHHHAVLDKSAEMKVLRSLPLDCEEVAAGCCGMAGSFGFEAAKYDVSMRIAEQGILPRITNADEATRIIANGFSCREQIEQATGRKTLHVAELLKAAS